MTWELTNENVAKARLVKLVRTGVGRFLGHATVEYRPIADPERRLDALRKKLVEEAIEYLLDPCLGELADVYEAVRALVHVDLGSNMSALLLEARAKRDERGSFMDGYGMYVTTTAPARHEGEHAT